MAEVEAVEAASWLDSAGLLHDQPDRPGAPLRKLLRDGAIPSGEQRPPVRNGRWFITRSSVAATTGRAGPARDIDAAPLDAFALTENDVVQAVCDWLENEGFEIHGRASTHERGIDVLARRTATGLELRVEAKGGTSSKPGTKRFARAFSASQVQTHVAKALFTAAAAPRTERQLAAIALPATELHRRYVSRIDPALRELTIGILWVSSAGRVDCDAPWSIHEERPR